MCAPAQFQRRFAAFRAERLCRGVFYLECDGRPDSGLIARCGTVADVQAAVRVGNAAGVSILIRCGVHSLAGFGSCDGGLVVDLSRMREVVVDEEKRRARFSGGCLLGSVDSATQKAGLALAPGVVSHTGAGGLVLGGGTGWLNRLHGCPATTLRVSPL